MTDINKMSGPELVKEYNARSGKKPIKRFGSVEEGRKRVKALLTGGKKKEDGLVGEFGVRAGTNRAKLLKKFEEAKRPIPRDDLMVALYRSKDKKWRGAFNQVINGLYDVISSKKLPFVLKEEKNKETKEVTYAITRK